MADSGETPVFQKIDPINQRVAGAGLTLFFLYLLNTLLVLDKIVFTILLEPIKKEFGLNDLDLGLLTGLVYAVCMGLASLPLGILADRSNRRNLAAACLAIWSAMTAACGIVQSFGTLLLLRVGVGIGEAGGGPSALSIISDLYGPKRRATAMAIFSLGTPTSALINLTLNTQIVHAWGWRAALFAAAVPGFLLAAAMLLFMKEPKRGTADRVKAEMAPPLSVTLSFIIRQGSLVHLLIGAMIAYIVLAGVSSFTFSFLVRQHLADLHKIGPMLGIAISGAGIVGLYLTGRIADWLGGIDKRWYCAVMALTTLGSVVFGFLAFTTPGLNMAIVFTACFAATSSLWLAPVFALTQSLVQVRMRGTIGAIVFLLGNLFGYGLGPLLVGALSDAVKTQGYSNSLQIAILIVVCGNLWAICHFLLASKRLRADLARV